MIGELSIISEWIPEQMEPGTVFVLENAGEVGEREDPYWAVLSCPSCGTLGLITRKQMAGLLPTICGSSICSAQFFIKDEEITAEAVLAGARLGAPHCRMSSTQPLMGPSNPANFRIAEAVPGN